MAKKPKVSSPSTSHENTTAIHAQTEDGSLHVVGIGNLRVLLSSEGGAWFAQGLEIDYFAEGSTVDEVKERFESGLGKTIRYHLEVFGEIDGMLKVAPSEIWNEFFGESKNLRLVFSRMDVYDLIEAHFGGIDYYKKAA